LPKIIPVTPPGLWHKQSSSCEIRNALPVFAGRINDAAHICKSPKLTDIYVQNPAHLNLRSTPYIYIIFFLAPISMGFAQQHQLEIKLDPEGEQEILQDLYSQQYIYSKDSVPSALDDFFTEMEMKGFLSARLDSLIQTDTTSRAYIYAGQQLKMINIRYGHIPELDIYRKELRFLAREMDSTHIRLPFSELPNFMAALADLFENEGYSFARVSLDHIELLNDEAWASLHLDQTMNRHIDKVVVKGYEKFPKNYIEQELDLREGSVFNREKIKRVSQAVNYLPFAEEQKPPEVLFTKDSTIVYLYLIKKRSNQFDGILGFASNEDGSGIELNGYLDLSINNIFNGGETIALFWKSNGQDRQRFYLETEVPYLFNTPLTPKVNFELYRQDSTFNNVKAQFSLHYNFKGQSQIAAHFNSESSNDLTNGATAGVTSYTSMFYGVSYGYRLLSNDPVFPLIFDLSVSGLLGTRNDDVETTQQSKFLLHANYLYQIDEKNYVFLQNNSGILSSKDFLENELFRIGGINNLRGVNEESIFTSSFTVFNLEYRYKPNPLSYFYSITDYAYTLDNSTDLNSSIWSIGLGYAFRTKAGLLNISYALGKFEDSPLNFDNSKIHIKMVSNF